MAHPPLRPNTHRYLTALNAKCQPVFSVVFVSLHSRQYEDSSIGSLVHHWMCPHSNTTLNLLFWLRLGLYVTSFILLSIGSLGSSIHLWQYTLPVVGDSLRHKVCPQATNTINLAWYRLVVSTTLVIFLRGGHGGLSGSTMANLVRPYKTYTAWTLRL